MEWQNLLSRSRLGRGPGHAPDLARNDFQRDFDRIVFSSAFRRLQDKTQVFPLSESDYIRTRLTHSLEAACVGRSLGERVGYELIRRDPAFGQLFHPSHLGAIVAAASLAHDIGNPPFGHAGENAISHWFRSDPRGQETVAAIRRDGDCASDFTDFEGNAQGFRVLSRLQHPEDPGGLQLTCATLAAFTKYPRGSGERPAGRYIGFKKFGFFADDQANFLTVAGEAGLARQPGELPRFARHPLAFLVEAADDICYHVVDIEDGFRMKLLTVEQVAMLLQGVLAHPLDADRIATLQDNPHSYIEYLRARAIGSLIEQVVAVFLCRHEQILAGTYAVPLSDEIDCHAAFAQLTEVARTQVYSNRETVLIEAAGFNVLGQLIDLFLQAVNEQARGTHVSAKTKTLMKIFPAQFLLADHGNPECLSLYRRVLAVTDFVSCMTDRYAISLFKKLTGISLPGE